MFPSLEEKTLNDVAQKAVRKARKEREPHLSYDDPETEEYQEFMSFKATKVVGYSILVAIVVVSLFFYLTK